MTCATGLLPEQKTAGGNKDSISFVAARCKYRTLSESECYFAKYSVTFFSMRSNTLSAEAGTNFVPVMCS